MADCCGIQIEPVKMDLGFSCPECGDEGRPIKIITLKSLLVPQALAKLEPSSSYKMCTDKACSVVYFNEKKNVFAATEVKVEVYTKSSNEDCPVCYCFGWTKKRLQQELDETGRSTAVDVISEHTKAGRCGCEVNNPEGYCCLGNVKRFVDSLTQS